jgi:pimeloyl-ACP methyl ester carboxylesterase
MTVDNMIEPFKVTWTRERFDRLRSAVAAYEFPYTPENDGWRYGCDPVFLRQLCDFWVHHFDFDALLQTLNRYPQLITSIEGLPLHAVNVVGEAEGRRPLLLTHGWPGSVFEFWDVIEPLAFPSRCGGRREDAFDLVIPSLPGYGFSGKPSNPISARATARLFDCLMRRLGYTSYRAQGGDWGSAVTAWLGLEHSASLEAIHLNYLLVQPNAVPETAAELEWRTDFDAKQRELGAYAMLQNTKPQSLAYAMAGNPVAQAAWIVERFHDWSDLRARSFEEIFDNTRLLTNIMIYIMNDAFISSTWFYAGALTEEVRTMPIGCRVAVPTAFACYPDPRIAAPPRGWVERGYAVSRWTEHPDGGHFAAMEAPETFVADLRDWARPRTPRA